MADAFLNLDSPEKAPPQEQRHGGLAAALEQVLLELVARREPDGPASTQVREHTH